MMSLKEHLEGPLIIIFVEICEYLNPVIIDNITLSNLYNADFDIIKSSNNLHHRHCQKQAVDGP